MTKRRLFKRDVVQAVRLAARDAARATDTNPLYKEALDIAVTVLESESWRMPRRPKASIAAATTSPEIPVGVYASVIEFCIRKADEYDAIVKASTNGDNFLATKAIAYREMVTTLSRGELPLTRCGECDQMIEGTRFCFNCIQVLKEKLFVSSLPAHDPCEIAGRHVCGPMDRTSAEVVKAAKNAAIAAPIVATDHEGED